MRGNAHLDGPRGHPDGEYAYCLAKGPWAFGHSADWIEGAKNLKFFAFPSCRGIFIRAMESIT